MTVLDQIERQLAVYASDLSRGFELRMTAVEKELVDMERRGHEYFEDTLRLGRVVDLLNRARVQKEFEERVVADAPRQIERRVAELIDWLIDQDFRQWQAVTTTVASRVRSHGSGALGAPEVGTFHADRTRLIDAVGREAQRVVETYDKRREAEAIAEQARAAVTTAAAAGGAAVGLGTLVTLAASTAAADVTGILLASVVAALGFLVIPARRRKAKIEMKQKVTALRHRWPTHSASNSSARRSRATRASNRPSPRTAGSFGPSTHGGPRRVQASRRCAAARRRSAAASLRKETITPFN